VGNPCSGDGDDGYGEEQLSLAAMKSPYIGTLVPNEVVTAQFLVLTKEIRQKKTGEPYLSLHLSDRTGEIDAKMWDNVAEVMNTFERDDFVKVKGLVQVYQNRSQFTVHRLRRLEDHEVEFADYFPCSDRDPEEMFAELRNIIAKIGNPHLRTLLETIFADDQLAAKYKIAPAAKNIHHACRSGLIEHVLSLCGLCRLMAGHYQNIDADLLIAGAILHDIGKVEELSYSRSFTYSAEGQLLGHIVIGLRMMGVKLDQLPDFPPKLRALLEHMIISHHGELEFGSPKVPVFPEALLLHHLDNIDSKMDAMRSALKRDRTVDGEFTGWISSLERTLLKKDRFLQDRPSESPVTAPATQAQETKPRVTPNAPGPPEPPPVPENRPIEHDRRAEHKPPPNTLFGEKLQAVLESRK
jgi:3'-5' exoribonuclease